MSFLSGLTRKGRLNRLNKKQLDLAHKALEIHRALQEFHMMKADCMEHWQYCKLQGDPVGNLSVPQITIS